MQMTLTKMKILNQSGHSLKSKATEFEECRRAFLNIYGMYSPSAALAFATQLTHEQVLFLKNDPRMDSNVKQVLDAL